MKINRDYITKINYTDLNNLSRIKYIVIHYFGSLSLVENLGKYWAESFAGASSHYGIGHYGEIYQYVEDEDIAWHCGAISYKHSECRNSNSIGIELAVRKRNKNSLLATDEDWYFEEETIKSAIELTKYLMKKYNITPDRVLRHYDVTGKICPNPFVYNKGTIGWEDFKKKISEVEIQNESKNDIYLPGNSYRIWTGLKEFLYCSDITAAVLLGNLDKESGLRPNNMENRYEKITGMDDETYTSLIDSKKYSKSDFITDKIGYGLAQWTYWSRKKDMYEFVVEKLGCSIGDLDGQIQFLIRELTTVPEFINLMRELERCTSIKEASDLVLAKFEAPADQSDRVKKERAEASEKYFAKYANVSKTTGVYLVRVTTDSLNIRVGPGTNHCKTGKFTGKGVFTILDTKMGVGSESGWGLLKSYSKDRNGWISLDFAKEII